MPTLQSTSNGMLMVGQIIHNWIRYNFVMSLTKQEVEHIAKLARLELTDEQKELYCGQLSKILDYVAKLNELDTKDVLRLLAADSTKCISAPMKFIRVYQRMHF